LPILISALLIPTLLVASFFLASGATGFLESRFFEGDGFPTWVRWIIIGLLFAAGIAPCYIGFRGIVMACYAPFLDKLSERSEQLLHGHAQHQERSLLDAIRRPVGMTLLTVGASLLLILFGLALGALPFWGAVLSPAIVFPLQLFLISVGFIDPYFERKGLSPGQSFRLMLRYFWRITFFGALSLVFIAIPVVGWFVGPTYSIIAGVMMGILISDEEAAKPGRKGQQPGQD